MTTDSINKSIVQFVLLLVALACVFVIIQGVQSFAYIINSILLAAVITLAILPLPKKLIRRGMKPSLALILSLLLIVVFLGGIGVLAFNSIENVSADIAASATEAATTDAPPPETLLSYIESMVSLEDVSQMLGTIVSSVGQVAAQFFAVMMIFIFMLSAFIATDLGEQMKDATDADSAGKIIELTAGVQQYISITTVVNALVGLGNAILLLILGVPGAALWGIFAWLMGYIPAIGFWFALIPPVLIAWGTQGIQTAAIVFAGYVIINGSVENFIKPRVMGEGLNISPLIVFVSLFAWGSILGAVGAILAIPLTMLVFSVLDSFEATRWIVVLARPTSSTEEHEKVEAGEKLRELWHRISRDDDKETEKKSSKS
jgi:predicted PurR-regulated permease PerM